MYTKTIYTNINETSDCGTGNFQFRFRSSDQSVNIHFYINTNYS